MFSVVYWFWLFKETSDPGLKRQISQVDVDLWMGWIVVM